MSHLTTPSCQTTKKSLSKKLNPRLRPYIPVSVMYTFQILHNRNSTSLMTFARYCMIYEYVMKLWGWVWNDCVDWPKCLSWTFQVSHFSLPNSHHRCQTLTVMSLCTECDYSMWHSWIIQLQCYSNQGLWEAGVFWSIRRCWFTPHWWFCVVAKIDVEPGLIASIVAVSVVLGWKQTILSLKRENRLDPYAK